MGWTHVFPIVTKRGEVEYAQQGIRFGDRKAGFVEAKILPI